MQRPAVEMIRTSLSTKLFVAILATMISVVLAMGVANGLSFSRGFLGYLNELSVQRMESVLPRFVSAWEQHQSWEFARDTPPAWFELIRPDRPVGEHDGTRFGRQTPVSDLTGAVFRITLLDAQGQRIMGYYQISPDAIRLPIVANQRTVGWLAMTPFQSVTEAGGQRFFHNQILWSLAIGSLCVCLAGLIAWWVARRLLAPVRQVAAATHRLAAGDYAERVHLASDDEAGQLARDFNQLAHTLERNERLRREFMADVSHELRTPLSVLRGELEALEDGVRKLDAASLQSLQGEVARLGKLVDDLYELSLTDVGALSYRKEMIDIQEEVRRAVASQQERFRQQGLRLSVEAPPLAQWFAADADRLQQLFTNLLENSLRYTDPEGEVRVVLSDDPELIRIDFMDSSPGVDEQQLPRLFERFFRTESSRSRASGGAGLGLAISQSIVVAHGGTLSAQRSPLGGLWLSIRLPKGAL
jgi:two-component system sensor histidine kinase BaeS